MVFDEGFNYRCLKRLAAGLLAAALGLGLASPNATAQTCGEKEVCLGIVLSAANLDRLEDARLEGHRIGDVLTERVRWQIEKFATSLRLVHKTPIALDPRHVAATENYAGRARLDDATKRVEGWVAGDPFPDIDPGDPDAGYKIIWNLTYGRSRGYDHDHPGISFLLVDAESGLERFQTWALRRLFMKGRIAGPPVIGDGDTLEKTLLYAQTPQDIKGLGSFSIRYDTGRLDDSWAYVREVRRTRRLSGGAWMNPIGSTDELQDDFGNFNAYPTWYDGYKLLGRRDLLVVAHAQAITPPEGEDDPARRFPNLELDAWPHWNTLDNWEVRPVYVIDATPPSEHPYSKRVLYVDAESWFPYMAEAYDHAGEFHKWMIRAFRSWTTEDHPDGVAVWPEWGNTIDFQRMHATVFRASPDWRYNVGLAPDDVSLAVLEAEGR